MGTGSSPEVKYGRGVLQSIHPLRVPRSWKSRDIPLPTLWATPGLSRDQFTFLVVVALAVVVVVVVVVVIVVVVPLVLV